MYDKYLARSKAASDPEERYRFLYGLAAFTDPALVRRTIDYIVGPEVRNQDAKLFIVSAARQPRTRRPAWQLLQERWDEVQKKTGEASSATRSSISALSSFCDAGTPAEVRQFFATHKVPDAERHAAAGDRTHQRVRGAGGRAVRQAGGVARQPLSLEQEIRRSGDQEPGSITKPRVGGDGLPA